MDFSLNEQQEMLKTMARDFLSAEYPEKLLRETAADVKGCTPELWRKMAEMNLMGLSIPEEYGGVGDFLDLLVVLEEMGRACLISPFFSTLVLGASAIIESGNEEIKEKLLPAINKGDVIMTLAPAGPSARVTSDAGTVRADLRNGGFVLKGTILFVPDARSADYLICAARTKEAADAADGITLFLVDGKAPGLDCQPLKTVSGDKQCDVNLNEVVVPADNVLGEVDKGRPCLEKVLAKAAVARCAEMVGAAQRMMEISLDYAKERQAFGHPIGAFQSIQHRCADMQLDIDGSRFVTYQAAWRLNEGLPAEREIAIAKAWASQACQRVAYSAHQIHGAIGFTWDHVLHFYSKKVSAGQCSFGDADYHLERLASLI